MKCQDYRYDRVFKLKTMRVLLFIFFIFPGICISQSIRIERPNEELDSILNPIKYYKGRSMPEFILTSISGNEYSDAKFKGKITFVNFWFKNCAPCIAEINALNKLYTEFKDNKHFQFISFTYEDPFAIEEIRKEYQIPYDIISVTREECKRLNFGKGFPSNFIYDKDAKIVFMKIGGKTDAAEVEKDFEPVRALIKQLY